MVVTRERDGQQRVFVCGADLRAQLLARDAGRTFAPGRYALRPLDPVPGAAAEERAERIRAQNRARDARRRRREEPPGQREERLRRARAYTAAWRAAKGRPR